MGPSQEGARADPPRRSWLYLASALIVNVVLALALRGAWRALASRDAALAALKSESADLRGLLNGFRQAILRQPLEHEFLRGREVRTQRPWRSDGPRDGAYYVVDTKCAICKINLPFLDSVAVLAADGPFEVIGLSFDETENLSRYLDAHRVKFPVLSEPSGRLVTLIPGNLSPVTIVITQGKVADILVGPIPESYRAHLKVVAASRAGSGAHLGRKTS